MDTQYTRNISHYGDRLKSPTSLKFECAILAEANIELLEGSFAHTLQPKKKLTFYRKF
jgi:hypothetical protein